MNIIFKNLGKYPKSENWQWENPLAKMELRMRKIIYGGTYPNQWIAMGYERNIYPLVNVYSLLLKMMI